MTDRLKGVYVAFDEDIRTDDAEEIITAISMIKHVAEVKPLVKDHADWVARARTRAEFINKVYKLLGELQS